MGRHCKNHDKCIAFEYLQSRRFLYQLIRLFYTSWYYTTRHSLCNIWPQHFLRVVVLFDSCMLIVNSHCISRLTSAPNDIHCCIICHVHRWNTRSSPIQHNHDPHLFAFHCACTQIYQAGVGVTKPIFPVPLFSEFVTMSKTLVIYWISLSYLQGSPPLSCGNTCQIWKWFQSFNWYFRKIENYPCGEINEGSFSNRHPWALYY